MIRTGNGPGISLISAGVTMISLVALGCYVIVDDGTCGDELAASPMECVSVSCGDKDDARLLSYDVTGTEDYDNEICVCSATQWEVIEVPVPGDPNETITMCGGTGMPTVPPSGYGQGGVSDYGVGDPCTQGG